MQFDLLLSDDDVRAIKERVKPPHFEGNPVIDEGMLARCLLSNDWLYKAPYAGHGKVNWAEQATNMLIMRVRGTTLQRCADHYGVNRERIRQVEANSLRRLRNLAGQGGFIPSSDVGCVMNRHYHPTRWRGGRWVTVEEVLAAPDLTVYDISVVRQRVITWLLVLQEASRCNRFNGSPLAIGEEMPVIDTDLLERHIRSDALYPVRSSRIVSKVNWAEAAGDLLLMRVRGVTLQRCADHFGVAVGSVRQVEHRIIRKLAALAGKGGFIPASDVQ